MIEKEYIISTPEGMHARPATALVRLAKNFTSVISICKGDKTVPLNSLLNLLSMGIRGGDVLRVRIEGEDETTAADALDHFFSQIKDL
ncbi:MAG TPA: HPr family phosphocarrier protein [Puia sp.]|nr:HPr family phosphocarrier protein [Puia sp.]